MKELSWRERGRLWLRLGIRLILALLALWGAVRLGPPLISLFAPFLLAFAAAWCLSPAVKWLHKHLGLPRNLLTLLLLALVFIALGGVLWALGVGIAREIIALARDWEGLMASIQNTVAVMGDLLSRGMDLLPRELQTQVNDMISQLLTWLGTAIPSLLSSLADSAANKAVGLPTFVVASVVFLLAAYFLTVDFPRLKSSFAAKLPTGPRIFLLQVKRAAAAGFGGYVKAQVILSVAVFFILLAGFMLIHQPYSLLLAFLLAVLDFIPMLGAGTAMIPWAIVELLTGRVRHAVGLVVVWGLVALFRRLAEPKVLGNQTGLSPVLSLISVYVGMRLGGVVGMIFGPVICLVAINITRAGVFENVWQDVRLAAIDITAILKGGEDENPEPTPSDPSDRL